MAASLIARALLPAALLMLTSACSGGVTVEVSETQFAQGYLGPLDDAGLRYSVEEVCHYARETPGEPWHLQVTVTVEASAAEVADALEGEVEAIGRDRDPMILQQYAGQPGRGWDGALEPSNGNTIIGVTNNNVEVDGDRPPVRWLPVCDPS